MVLRNRNWEYVLPNAIKQKNNDKYVHVRYTNVYTYRTEINVWDIHILETFRIVADYFMKYICGYHNAFQVDISTIKICLKYFISWLKIK